MRCSPRGRWASSCSPRRRVRLEIPHVVGPDIGTGAALFAAALHPGRFRSLVVGSGGAAFPLQLGSVLKDWVEAPDLDAYRGADPRAIVGGADRRHRALRGSRSRARGLPLVLRRRPVRRVDALRAQLPDAELPILGDLLPQIQTPVQIIAGRPRPAVPPVNADYLHERLPKSKLDLIDAGHFVWEDAADEYAALVTSWWSGGYAAAGSAAAG